MPLKTILARTFSICTILLVTAAVLSAKSEGRDKPSALAKFSSAQLQACYKDLKLCGAKSVYEISDEFEKRLPSFATEQLVECFDNWKICGVGEDRASGWPISDELARRGRITPILDRFWHEPNLFIRNGIEHVAYHFDTPEVIAFMRKVFAAKMDDGEDLYWPINFLAKHCDPTPLQLSLQVSIAIKVAFNIRPVSLSSASAAIV